MAYKYLVATYPDGRKVSKRFETGIHIDPEEFDQAIEWFVEQGASCGKTNRKTFEKHEKGLDGQCEKCLVNKATTRITPPQHELCTSCADDYCEEVEAQTARIRALGAKIRE